MNPSFKMEKHEKTFVVEHPTAINDLLEETFKSSQRIKLVSYDVSKSYIAFGANNGSIHIYRRGPNATFLKLIPSKNSAAIEHISISPNEENVLVTDETGSILILENCFLEVNFYSHIFPELRGKKVTCIKWDGDIKVYVGDSDGTVAVLSLPKIVSIALLHTPYVSLMDLGASIVQIDTFSRFMLVTTERKIFICDTEREMYKQVGRKDKGKALGACFYNTFEKVPESIDDYSGQKIYCTRPGLRMWQANFEGEVFYTHKYRNAIPNISEILKFEKVKDANLETEDIVKTENEKFFGKIFVFEKYLAVVSAKSLYVIDPEKGDLLFHYFTSDSIDVRLVDEEIFLWNLTTGKLRVMHFYTFEDLMRSITKGKQYKLGVELVVKYKKDVVEWSKHSPNSKLVTNLRSKLSNIDQELVREFVEVLQEIVDFDNEQMGKYIEEDDPKIGYLNTEDVKLGLNETEDKICEKIQLMYRQFKLNESNSMILMPQFTDMLLDLSENDMTQLFLDFVDYVKSLNEELKIEWCYSQFLQHFHLNKSYKKLKEMNSVTVDFVTKSFLEMNKDIAPCCTCTFPLPSLTKTQPRYDNIGLALSKYSEENKYLFGKIPHLWFHQISKLRKIGDMEKNLPLILQFGYVEILKKVSKHVTYDFCDKLVSLFLKLKAGYCLNCGKAFPDENCKQIADWEYLGLTLIPFIGADNVLKLFLNRHEDIPKDELSERFYVACMFTKVQDDCSENGEEARNRAKEMASNFIGNRDTKNKFKGCLEAFLNGKVNKGFNADLMMKKLTCNNCSYCKILLKHPVLNHIEQLECGHAFHAICLVYIKRVCNICFSS